MQEFDLTGALRRWWGLIVGAVLVGALAGFVVGPPSSPVTTTYTASHILLVEGTTEPGKDAGLVAFLATVGVVPERVAARIGGGATAQSVSDDVEVTSSELGAVTISAESPQEAEAIALVDAFGEELLTVRLDEQRATLTARLAEIDADLAALNERAGRLQATVASRPSDSGAAAELNSVTAEVAQATQSRADVVAELENLDGSLRTVQPGTAVAEETGGSDVPLGRIGTALIGAVAGLLLGAIAALLLARHDPRLHDRRAVEQSYGFTIVAGIPVLPRPWRRRREIITTTEPTSPSAEAYRKLRTTVDRLLAQSDLDSIRPLRRGSRTASNRSSRGGDVVLVSSALPSEGKTTLVANLAAAYARSGRSVVVVSGDLRAPSVNEFLDVAPDLGLADVASSTLPADRLLHPTSLEGVKMVLDGSTRETRSPADRLEGPPASASPGDLLEHARAVIDDLRKEADVVLIDTPPLLPFNDVGALLPAVDGVLVVARLGKVTAADGIRTHEALDRLGAPVLGVVVVGEREDAQVAAYYAAAQRGSWRRWTGQLSRPVRVSPEPDADGRVPSTPVADEAADGTAEHERTRPAAGEPSR